MSFESNQNPSYEKPNFSRDQAYKTNFEKTNNDYNSFHGNKNFESKKSYQTNNTIRQNNQSSDLDMNNGYVKNQFRRNNGNEGKEYQRTKDHRDRFHRN